MQGLDGATGDVPRVVTGEALRYVYRVWFGHDAQGPYGVLMCSYGECDAHQAVRPGSLDYGDGDIFAALLDFAEQDGWVLIDGAWCPAHAGELRCSL